ncbi:MAG TPA: alpha/beta hydrolase [Solirubrobacteraceae bacterium]|nr:alpha/beta hydrolase [Solirubrobacteraceae bacterium]
MSVWQLEGLSVDAGEGRALEVVVGGPPDGVPLIFFHGTPGAAGPFDRLIQVGADRGVRHIAYSRPGYSRSDRHQGRSVASCAADVVAIADALGYDRFYCSGGSGGGPHSIACAALIPDRVIAVAAIATPAPVDAEDFDWAAGMGQENLEEFAAARAGERQLREYLEREAAAVNGATADDLLGVWRELFCESDRRVLSGAYAEHTLRQIGRSLASGIWGWLDDDLALVADWGFGLDEVAAPVHVWHGAEDQFVPVSHGEWLAGHLPKAKAELRPGAGHLSITLSSYGDILDALLED